MPPPLFYLTYAEQPSGVYSGQVNDVVRFLKQSTGTRIRLVAFISMRNFSHNRRQLKAELPDSIVLPMLPKAGYWKFNTIILALICLICRTHGIIARNVIAANMALMLKHKGIIRKCTFDGRGAIAAEWHEYDVRVIPSWKKKVKEMEKKAVLNSDFRIAVSHRLVDYWREWYGYRGDQHVVIPCTLDSKVSKSSPDTDTAKSHQSIRAQHGFQNHDIILAYAGSTAGWQSFGLLETILEPYLLQSPSNKVLFLSQQDPNIEKLISRFSAQVSRCWVSHQTVPELLSVCDMGILIREQSITNRVAAPTKFAEYLASGLRIIISENLGDYSDFVLQENCGTVAGNGPLPTIEPVTEAERVRMKSLMNRYFTKEAHEEAYRALISSMSGDGNMKPVSIWKDPATKKQHQL